MKNLGRNSTVAALAAAFALALPGQALAVATVNLGAADSFAVLGAEEVTNVPTSTITGDVGLSPASGSFYSGITQAQVNGTIYSVDAAGPAGRVTDPALLTQAKNDLTAAYLDAAGRTPTDTFSATDNQLGGQTLTQGVYRFGHGDNANLTGTLTLSGDASSVFIFQATSDLVTASSSVVNLIGGAQACHVFWQVASSTTLGTDSSFVGTIMSLTSTGLNTRATLVGRAMARNANVTLDQNVITNSPCASTTPGAGSGLASAGSSSGSSSSGVVPKFPNTGFGPGN